MAEVQKLPIHEAVIRLRREICSADSQAGVGILKTSKFVNEKIFDAYIKAQTVPISTDHINNEEYACILSLSLTNGNYSDNDGFDAIFVLEKLLQYTKEATEEATELAKKAEEVAKEANIVEAEEITEG